MNEFDRILPKNLLEMEPLGRLGVIRREVVGYDWNDNAISIRPPTTIYFNSLKSSLPWAVANSPRTEMANIDYFYTFYFPIPGASLKGALQEDKKHFVLQTDTRSWIVKVEHATFYKMMRDDSLEFDLAIFMRDSQAGLIVGSMALLSLPKLVGPPRLLFTLNIGDRGLEELADGIDKVRAGVNRVVDMILDGEVE